MDKNPAIMSNQIPKGRVVSNGPFEINLKKSSGGSNVGGDSLSSIALVKSALVILAILAVAVKGVQK